MGLWPTICWNMNLLSVYGGEVDGKSKADLTSSSLSYFSCNSGSGLFIAGESNLRSFFWSLWFSALRFLFSSVNRSLLTTPPLNACPTGDSSFGRVPCDCINLKVGKSNFKFKIEVEIAFRNASKKHKLEDDCDLSSHKERSCSIRTEYATTDKIAICHKSTLNQNDKKPWYASINWFFEQWLNSETQSTS